MVRRELAKDPKLANASWDRFLPKFKKRNLTTAEKSAKRRARGGAPLPDDDAPAGPSTIPKPKKEKKAYTPFPPPLPPRKVRSSHVPLLASWLTEFLQVDIEMETGEYWLKPQVKQDKAERDKLKKVRYRKKCVEVLY